MAFGTWGKGRFKDGMFAARGEEGNACSGRRMGTELDDKASMGKQSLGTLGKRGMSI